MTRGVLALALAALLLSGAGCGGDETESTTTPTGGQPATPITFTKGGGVAGIAAELTIDVDGVVTLVTGYSPDVEKRELDVPEAQVDEIVALAEEADYPQGPGPETGCADCFLYAVSSPAGEASYDDVSLADAPGSVAELIGRLNALVDAELFPATTDETSSSA